MLSGAEPARPPPEYGMVAPCCAGTAWLWMDDDQGKQQWIGSKII